ncbi:MAG: hypothetical protein R3C19_12205 [Planctomycetaceae bacterium]
MTDEREQLWKKMMDDLLKVVLHYRFSLRCYNGEPEDLVVSAIKSGLSRANCPPIEDPTAFKFLRAILETKLDTASHAYRTQEGRTVPMSRLADDGISLDDLFTDLRAVLPEATIDGLPIDQPITRRLVEHCIRWVDAQVASFENPLHRDVLRDWVDGCSIEQIAKRLQVSDHKVKTARRAIKAELRRRAEA